MKSIWLKISFSLLLVGCSSAKVVNDISQDPSPDFLLIPGSLQHTFKGKNYRPHFSPDGQRMLYVSSERLEHQRGQIYEILLKENRERRVTFQDGHCDYPRAISTQEIVYASTTDEIKESPFINKNSDSLPLPPFEIYKSDRFGNEIERLTQYPGFDGQMSYIDGQQNSLLFSSLRGGILALMRLNIGKGQVQFFQVDKNRSFSSPATSRDGKHIAWVEVDKKNESSKIIYTSGKIRKEFLANQGEIADLNWSEIDNRLVYAFKPLNEKFFHLESIDPLNSCRQVLLKGKDSLTQPATSNAKESRLAFVRQIESRSQIYSVPYPIKTEAPCLETK